MANQFNIKNLLIIINKWKKQLLIILIISIILSTFLSSPIIITPLYKSYTIVYPANVTPYSEETETEQLLQLMYSDDIKLNVIKKLNLSKHYKIDTTLKNYRTIILKKFNKYFSISKSDYEAIEIYALDRDPTMAYNIVKTFLEELDLKARQLQREKSKELVMLWKKRMDEKQREMDSLKYCLDTLRTKNNVAQFEAQVREVSRQYFTHIREKGEAALNTQLSKTLKKLEEKGAEMFKLEECFKVATIQYLEYKKQYENFLSDVTKELTYTHLVSTPKIPDEKAYPIRWLIILLFTIFSMFISILVIMILEQTRKN